MLGDVTNPFASVVAVAVVEAVSEKVALGPVTGAANVTTKPLTGPPLLVTVATSAVPNVPLTPWLWGVPPVAIMDSTALPIGTLPCPVAQLVEISRQTAVNTNPQAFRFIASPGLALSD